MKNDWLDKKICTLTFRSIFIPAIIFHLPIYFLTKTKIVIPKIVYNGGRKWPIRQKVLYFSLHFYSRLLYFTFQYIFWRRSKSRNMKGWEKRQANEKARYRNKKVEERRENDWLSKTRQSYPHVSVRPSVRPFLGSSSVSWKIFAPAVRTLLRAKRNRPWIPVSVHSRPPPTATALCLSARRELRLPSVNMSARIFGRAARRPATFIEAVAQTLICPLLLATRTFTSRASPRVSTRFVDPSAILSRPTGIRFSFQPMPSFFPFSFHARIFRENFFFFSSFYPFLSNFSSSRLQISFSLFFSNSRVY